MRAFLFVLLFAISPGAPVEPLLAQAPDSVPEREPLFTRADAWLAGGFVLGTVAMAPLDIRLAEIIRDSVPQTNRVLRLGAGGFRLLGFPGSVLISGGFIAAGQLTDRPRLTDIGVHTTEAILLGQVVNGTVKILAGRARPRRDAENPFNFSFARGVEGDDYQSFPSGHTAAAFATAAALAHELAEQFPERKFVIGSLLYTSAGLVGISRMYENWHWASDVVLGAAMGSFAGWKVVRYTHAYPDNRVDRWIRSLSITADSQGPLLLVSIPTR